MTTTCPYCKSEAIYRLRREGNWTGPCNFTPVFKKAPSRTEQKNEISIPDIDMFYCPSCKSFFDPHRTYPSADWIDAEQMKHRIDTITEKLCFYSQSYKNLCTAFRKKISEMPDCELTKRVPALIAEMSVEYGRIRELNEALSVLEHIYVKDKQECETVIRPSCYRPEENNIYPLCAGAGKLECTTCGLYARQNRNRNK